MKNTVFMKKTTDQKRRYLRGVLEHVGGGVVDDRTARRILSKVAIHKQYTVSVFCDNSAFQEAIARAQIGKVRMSIVFSRTGHGITAAVITSVSNTDTQSGKRVIYILAPIKHAGKGRKNGQRFQRTHSV